MRVIIKGFFIISYRSFDYAYMQTLSYCYCMRASQGYAAVEHSFLCNNGDLPPIIYIYYSIQFAKFKDNYYKDVE